MIIETWYEVATVWAEVGSANHAVKEARREIMKLIDRGQDRRDS